MYTEKIIKLVSRRTAIDISKFNMDELILGMEVELEHGSVNPETDITGDDPELTFKIVISHLNEMPNYYTKLKNMEKNKKKSNIQENRRSSKYSYIIDDGGDRVYTLPYDVSSVDELLSLSNEDDELYSFLNSELTSSETINFNNGWGIVGSDLFDFMRPKKQGISEYAKRMRELSGFAEAVDLKSIKSVQEGDSTFDGGSTFYARDMAGYEDSEESEEFIPSGSYTMSNSGGYEIMLSDSGDAARVRDAYGSNNPKTSDWLEIEYVDSEDGELDDEGFPNTEPVIDPNGYNIPLNQVMRINESKNHNSDFESHEFESEEIEEGEDDSLYNLNENTIIVLDFLDEE